MIYDTYQYQIWYRLRYIFLILYEDMIHMVWCDMWYWYGDMMGCGNPSCLDDLIDSDFPYPC